MELEHRFTVSSAIGVTWATFNDLEMVAPCFPGATLTSADDDGFTGSVKIKLGPIALQYNGSGKFIERDEATHTAVIEARGRDKRGNGTATATVRAQLSPDGEETLVEVTTDLAITGKPAQFGRGVIQDVSDKLLGQFVACLQDKLSGPSDGDAAVDSMTTAPVGAEPVAHNTPATPVGQTVVRSARTPAAVPTASGASGQVPEVELNLLGAVGPALLKRYGPTLLAGLAGLLLGYCGGRRRTRRS